MRGPNESFIENLARPVGVDNFTRQTVAVPGHPRNVKSAYSLGSKPQTLVTTKANMRCVSQDHR